MGRQSRGTTGGLSKSAAGSRRVRQELTQTARELVERSFAHCYDTGGMRRTHLRGHKNILKRQLIHLRRSVQPSLILDSAPPLPHHTFLLAFRT